MNAPRVVTSHRDGVAYIANYADTLGLPEVVGRMRRIYVTQSGDARRQYWAPAALFTELAESNLKFTRQ